MSSSRKRTAGKITLGMLKGKPIATSVPAIAIRFHANGEELEELYPSEEEDETHSSPSPVPTSTVSDEAASLSIGADVPSAGLSGKSTPKPDASPMKEYLNRVGRASISGDSISIDGSTDRWRIFNELKGKFTKTVEEKINEIKATSSPKITTDPEKDKSEKFERSGALGKLAGSRDNSSVSDSEDVSISESSTSKFADVEMSGTEDETPSISSDAVPSAPATPVRQDDGIESSIDEITEPTPIKRSLFRNRFRKKEATNGKVTFRPGADDTQIQFAPKTFEEEVEMCVEATEESTTPKTAEERESSTSNIVAVESEENSLQGVVLINPSTFVDVRERRYLTLFEWIKCYYFQFATFVFVISLYYVPMASFLKGFLAGAFLVAAVIAIYYSIFMDAFRPLESFKKLHSDTASMIVAPVKEHQPLCRFEGWMNEYPDVYDTSTYRVTDTQSVWIRLEGERLRVSTGPGVRVPKRAMWNEPPLPRPNRLPFTHHRIYNMRDAKVFLLPVGIARNKFWSKKYPICLEFDKSKTRIIDRPLQKTSSDNAVKENEDLVKLDFEERELLSLNVTPKDSRENIEEKSYEGETKTKEDFISSVKSNNLTIESLSALDIYAAESGSAASDLCIDAETDAEGENTVQNFVDTILEEDAEDAELLDNEDLNPVSGSDWQTVNCEDLPDNTTRIYLFARASREKEEWYRRFVASIHFKERAQVAVPVDGDEVPAPDTEQETAADPFEVKNTGSSSSSPTCSPSKTVKSTEKSFRKQESLSGQISTASSETEIETVELSKAEAEKKLDNEYLQFMARFQELYYYMDKDRTTSNRGKQRTGLPFYLEREPAQSTGRKRNESKYYRKYERVAHQVEHSLENQNVSSEVMWVNALLGRMLFDTVREDKWIDKIQQRVQRKLSSIKLPYFMEELIVSELQMGKMVPIIHRASLPWVDDRGLWMDLDVTYGGSVNAIVTTKLNLMKLKKTGAAKKVDESRAPVYNSDLDDTAESSSEDEATANWLAAAQQKTASDDNKLIAPAALPAAGSGNTSSKKLLRIVDRIAASKVFQQATENKFVKRAMEGVSRTELKLCVEVRGLNGTLRLNIPPPPSDRLWFGFKTNPQIWLVAYPVVGERSLNFNHISSWIERKLQLEFQKVLVLPNMEDISIPIMTSKLPE